MNRMPRFVKTPLSRRDFLKAGAVVLSAGAAARLGAATGSVEAPGSLVGRLFKTLKIGMVDVPGSLSDKFRAVKDAGFDGIELNAPGLDVEAAKTAIAETGLPVDGTVCSTHWDVRHSDPSADVRAQALTDLRQAIRETHAVGGHSVLLVPGHGNDGSEDEVWERSVANIRQAVPLAARLGVSIAIENVWNQFLYEHEGPDDQTADAMSAYIDAFHSPWVGAQFDIGNHQRYGPPAEWIRTLGKRIVKLDVKDWGVENGWARIGEGDVAWPAVRRALLDIHYAGWVAAEVSGGGPEELRAISGRMDDVFAI